MNAHGLRIGNYILKNDKLHYCSWMTIRDIKTQSIEETDKFEPIPLTEEWLLKFGFEKNVILRVFTVKEFPNFVIIDCADIDKPYKLFINCKSIEIKYIHQLQNLFFALTGEELTIKN